MTFELVHVNIGRMAAPADDPKTMEFIDSLGPVFALSEAAPGFVWRQTEDDPGFEWDKGDSAFVLVNISVWASLEELKDFTYSSEHLGFLRRRREWFQHMDEAAYALWWVPAGHQPSTAEAEDRIRHLREHGSTAYAFTFNKPFPAGIHPPRAVPADIAEHVSAPSGADR